MRQPDQPVYIDEDGTARFRANAIVRYLLDTAAINMNHIALIPFAREDRVQFVQLIGYSVSGIGDLPYMKKADVRRADAAQARLGRKKKARR